MKKDAVYSVIQILMQAETAASNYATERLTIEPQLHGLIGEKLAEALSRSISTLKDFERQIATSLLVCGSEFNNTLSEISAEIRRVIDLIRADDDKTFANSEKKLGRLINDALSLGRKELRIPEGSMVEIIKPQSSESSAALSPGSQRPK
jgi:hypothetical protein